MIRLTRRYRFSASHRLHTTLLPSELNRELYGKCNNPYGHGHDYLLEVSVRGPIDPVSGRAADLAALDRLVQSRVLDSFDRRDLNVEAPEFADTVPTTENLAIAIGRRLRQCWPSEFPGPWPQLEKIRIRETARNIVEICEI